DVHSLRVCGSVPCLSRRLCLLCWVVVHVAFDVHNNCRGISRLFWRRGGSKFRTTKPCPAAGIWSASNTAIGHLSKLPGLFTVDRAVLLSLRRQHQMKNRAQHRAQIAVVGAGYWGVNHVRNFYEFGALSVVCDTSQPSLERVAERFHGVRIENDFRKVLG